jgi:chloramphenicol 3-O phosphotransferase
MKPGCLIVLNGNSSVGKSTIAGLIQAELEEPFLHTGLDHFIHRTRESLIGPPEAGAVRGWEVTFTDGELAGPPRITQLGYQIINGIYAAIAAYCRAGNNAIVDHVVYDLRTLELARENFTGLTVFSLGLACDLDEARRREASRGDRAPGGAVAFHDLVHRYTSYDFRLDVTHMPPAEAAHRIVSAYLAQPGGTAFWADP